ncbi:heparinase (plasmid) [Pedobacter sp. BS3]|nr:heparinase [Pedobacter sp. BS3]
MVSKAVHHVIILIGLFSYVQALAQTNNKTILLSRLDLSRPGLEQVNSYYLAGDTNNAANALLNYYRNRTTVKHPDVDLTGVTFPTGAAVSASDLQKANDALTHHFFVHDGYESYFYGDDINWQYWPVHDNELRWQLHRMPWWMPMAVTYASTGDERYAVEWMAEYVDWIKKNPLGLSADNDRFAWRPLEVSERLESQSSLIQYFIKSPNFTPEFLVAFLNNYYDHAEYLIRNYTDEGNHLLFEAQRMIYAGTFFPEFKNADTWRQSGIDTLNNQINIQVYPDGLQNELSFNYHIACINIFYEALKMLKINGIEGQFPASYAQTVEKMILAEINFSYPDYTYPMFSDAQLVKKSGILKQYKRWADLFPDNPVIQYFASDGQTGSLPTYTSSRLENSGIYTFRSGWDMQSTVMVLKASPPGKWHSQPDNGTFELWVKGRNFMPDSGPFIYEGDATVNAERDWFKQTRVHNTLTLNNQNITVNANCLQWSASPTLDMLVYENPSYTNLTHRRSVYFVNKTFFVIVDEAIGSATGKVALHYEFKEGNVIADQCSMSVTTTNSDKNNITLKCFAPENSAMELEDGYVSYSYNTKVARPAYAIGLNKSDNSTLRFLTVIYPYSQTMVPPVIEGRITSASAKKLTAKITIDGQDYTIGYDLP